jgi:hypothetical protein
VKDKLVIAVLGIISTVLGILIGAHQLAADYVTKDTFIEHKVVISTEINGIERRLDEMKEQQAIFRRETNEKLDELLRRN